MVRKRVGNANASLVLLWLRQRGATQRWHAIACIWLTVGVASASMLQISVVYPSANLEANEVLYLRGDFSPLSWDVGTALTPVGVNQWRTTVPVAASLIGVTLSFKVLVQDSDWQVHWLAIVAALIDALARIYRD